MGLKTSTKKQTERTTGSHVSGVTNIQRDGQNERYVAGQTGGADRTKDRQEDKKSRNTESGTGA